MTDYLFLHIIGTVDVLFPKLFWTKTAEDKTAWFNGIPLSVEKVTTLAIVCQYVVAQKCFQDWGPVPTAI